MNKDRIIGAAKTVDGNVKQTVGKVVGDQKTVADGKTEAVEGKVQNAFAASKIQSGASPGKSDRAKHSRQPA
jgi:uncharacterized protein YjbJ (UPF0337 family)